jgi:hypothetical protein
METKPSVDSPVEILLRKLRACCEEPRRDADWTDSVREIMARHAAQQVRDQDCLPPPMAETYGVGDENWHGDACEAWMRVLWLLACARHVTQHRIYVTEDGHQDAPGMRLAQSVLDGLYLAVSDLQHGALREYRESEGKEYRYRGEA